MSGIVALDLFAGTGWGVACQRLGIEEHGVEIMPEAVASRESNGMHTAYRDVWDGLEGNSLVPEYDLLIASPPCQTFSMAGGGKGRQALNEVVGLIDSRAYFDVAKLRAFGELHDPRTALVLTPLAHIVRDLPIYVALEQVPPVLPVWQRYAEELRKWGYSVWCGILNAEQHGVPQTRNRALLIARADGIEATPPAPTHSRYYSRAPKRLDPGVLPWVSMAEALGWPPLDIALRSQYQTGHGERAGEPGEREADQPAPTMTSKAYSNIWYSRPATTLGADDRIAGPGRSEFVKGGVSRQDRPGTVRVTIDQAATLQSYPEGFQFSGKKMKQFLQVGNAVPPLLAQAVLDAAVAQ